MNRKLAILFITATFFMTASLLAQGRHHNNSHPGLWPDSLETIIVTGQVMIDSSAIHPMYFLDENGDQIAEYHLSFGPWWYQPESGALRPNAGDTVTIVGALGGHSTPTTLVVFEINGAVWREAVEYGRHGWVGEHFWSDSGDTLTASGVVMVDTSYFYHHYFLDTNNDSIPEYKLGFGPPWYDPESGAVHPNAGDTIQVFGRVHEMMGIDMLTVYVLNGMEWRPLDQPAPWAGSWMHRGHQDTAFAYCVNDSSHWIGFPAGHMRSGMGGMMWPDSVYVQFWEIHPDSLPGFHDDEHFRGFYVNIHEPSGRGMMDGRFGGHHGRMRFQGEHQFQFQYDDEELSAMGLSEDGMMVKYWDEQTQNWTSVSGITVDTDANTVTFKSADLSNYYSLAATPSVTGIEGSSVENTVKDFILLENFPNPFNPSTTIRFELPYRSHVELSVYNMIGQRVAVLLSETRNSGVHQIQWRGQDESGRNVTSGIYFIQITAGDQIKVHRVTLLK